MEPVPEWPIMREMTPTVALEAIPDLGAVRVSPVLPIGNKTQRNQPLATMVLT